MRDIKPPFQFDFRTLLEKGCRCLKKHVGDVTINLPFISLSVKPEDPEKKAAREIVIRMADRRVLNTFECCDDCIDRALTSLQQIRLLLVDKQVELGDLADGPLYLLIELMLEGLRQFFTFEERLQAQPGAQIPLPERYQRYEARDQYFAALEMLRAHLHRCLLQIAEIGQTQIPRIAANMRYNGEWQLEAYVPVALPNESLQAEQG